MCDPHGSPHPWRLQHHHVLGRRGTPAGRDAENIPGDLDGVGEGLSQCKGGAGEVHVDVVARLQRRGKG